MTKKWVGALILRAILAITLMAALAGAASPALAAAGWVHLPQESVAVSAVQSSGNVDPNYPAAHLMDKNFSTEWRSLPGQAGQSSQPGQLWAILELDGYWQVAGVALTFAGVAPGEFSLEYDNGNGWVPFRGATHLKAAQSTGGTLNLDLSRDRVATSRILVTVRPDATATPATYLGGLMEVELKGQRAVFLPKKIRPLQIIGSDGTNQHFPAINLFDGKTFSFWSAQPFNGAAPGVEITLPAQYDIDQIGFFGAITASVNPPDPAAGVTLSLEYLSDGQWLPAPGLTGISSSSLHTGWNTFNLAGSVPNAGKLRLTIHGASGSIALREMEIWGRPAGASAGSLAGTSGAGGPSNLPWGAAALPVERRAFPGGGSGAESTSVIPGGGPSAATFQLPADLSGLVRPVLSAEVFDLEDPQEFSALVNGSTLGLPAQAAGFYAPDQWKVLDVEVDPAKLGPGYNYFDFASPAGDGYKLGNLLVSFDGDEGYIKPIGVNWDTAWKTTSSYPASAAFEAGLGGTYLLRALAIRLPEVIPQSLRVEFFDGAAWQSVPGLENVSSQEFVVGWNYFELPQPVTGDQIRIVFTNTVNQPALGGVGEVAFWGSPVNVGAPTVKIASPAVWEVVANPVTVTGAVDDPNAAVTVNGKPVDNTNPFTASVDLDTSGPKTARTITVQAVGSNGLIGQDAVEVYLNKRPPIMAIAQPADWLVIANGSVGVSGSFDDNDVLLTINGVSVDVTDRKFLHTVSLKEGLNVIDLVARDHFGNATKAQRHVIKDTQAPVVTIEGPANGATLPAAPAEVFGQARDTTAVTVTVNGKPAAVSGGYFRASGLTFVPGTNSITVVATDQLGHATTVTASFVVDATPPVVRITTPEVDQLFNAAPITVSGTVSDENAVSVFVNGVTAVVQNGTSGTGSSGGVRTFVASGVPLGEGSNMLTAEAVDLAGNKAQDARRVALDTTPPLPFAPVANPTGWTPVQTPTITFATTDATSGVDHYELKIDDGAYVTVMSPYTLPPLADGIHAITVKAVDRAGWETIGTAQVYVDATPPAAFTPVADPAGWTPNTTPAITFGATDATSGIDHYELKVDSGPYTIVASPYTLPVQADGVHTITVRAVDRAGLINEGTCQVFIDTVAPALPTGLELIPGPDSVTVKWQPNPEEDVIHYVLRREPAFSDGTAVKTITREQGASYKDLEVAPGSSYAYQIQAVDHAQNASSFTQLVQARAGVTFAPVDSATGGAVKYENVQLEIPQGALPQSTLVTVATVSPESTPPVSNTENVRVGSVYNFAVTDSPDQITTGQEVEFARPVTVSLNFREADIPAGYTAADLYVYTYDEVLGRWVRLPRLKLDLVNKTIITQTQHFSMYGIQATASNPMSPEDYKDLGVAPYQTYFRDNTETVSPSSGGLTVEATDLVLPGRNGLDLKITRVYDSLASDADYKSHSYLPFFPIPEDKTRINSFGQGWTLDLPGLKVNDQGQSITLPKGATYEVKWSGGGGYLYFEQHEGEHFRLEQIRHKTGEHEVRFLGIYLYTAEDWALDSYRLILKDGTQYVFNTEGKVTEIVDRTGNNRIRIEYAGRNLTRMVDTLGREVKFVYSGDKIVTITGGGKKVAYSYDGANLVMVTYTDTGEDQSLAPHPQDRVTKYGYTPVTVTYGQTTYGSGISSRTFSFLNSITYPSGGKSQYQYVAAQATYQEGSPPHDEDTVNDYYLWKGYRLVVTAHNKLANGDGSQQFENTSFSYTIETQDPDKLLRLYSTVVDEPNRRTEYSFTEKSLVASKLIRDLAQGGLAVEKTDYQYQLPIKLGNNQYYDPKLPIKETIYKGNALQGLAHAFDMTYAYDGWGNRTYEYNGATGLETWWGYANSSTENLQAAAPGRGFAAPPFGSSVWGGIHDLATARGSVNYNPASGATQIVQTQYRYDYSGNLLTEARRHDGGWVTTSYAYDQYGNMVQKVDPDGRTTVVEYAPGYAYAYPTRVTVKNVVDADGLNTGDVVSEYGYNSFTGLKTWERNGRGHVTTYAYDRYNRLRRTVFADEDDGGLRPGDAGWAAARASNPLKQADFDDVLNTYTVTDEEGRRVLFQYDGLGHLLSVTQYQRSGSPGAYAYDPYAVTSFAYDAAGNVVAMTDANGRTTTYAYDGLGRNVRVSYADATPETWDNPNSQTSYDDLWRTTTLIDPNGHQTIQHKDWAGRIVQVDQYETATGQIYRSYAAYDRLGQKVQATDGRGAVTRMNYDDLGRLIETSYPAVPMVKPGTGWEVTESPRVTYAYDNAGNKIAETSALGNAQDGVDRARYTTTYTYDALSRPVKTVEPFTQVDDPGTPQLYQRVTKTFYDPAGNKVKVVDGNGHAAIYAYDARNRLTAETDALGNTTTYAYDRAGNKIRTTDPRGTATAEIAGDYTTWYRYDDLNRLIQAILPDNTPPVDPFASPADNPTVTFTYDQVGNKLTEQDPNGNVTRFTYTERYWLKEAEDAAGHKTAFGYDLAGNQTSVTDARQNTTRNVYDDLNRVMETIDPEFNHRFFYYDAVGNRTKVVDSNYNKTEYAYNALNKLTAVTDAGQGVTRYQYDPNGNLVATIDARGNVTTYAYNELNWLTKEVQEANGTQRTTTYRYDLAGNRKAAVDPKGVPAVYAYLANNLLQSVTWGPGRPESVQIGYTYDPSGNRTGMSDPSGATAYAYDPLNQLIEVGKAVQGTAYTTGYAYDRAGNLSGIKYPNSSQWLAHTYNNLNQLVGVGGFATGDAANPAFTYDAAGNLASLRYDNGVATAYTLDKLNRRTKIEATSPSLPSPVLALNFRYDGEGNILQRNDNLYSYDGLNRLQAAQVKGIFHEETGGQPGYAGGDLLGKKAVNFTLDPGTVVGLDYGSSSIGLDFGRQVAAVDTIHLKKDQPGSTYRVNQKALEVLYSNDNTTYTKVADSTWKFTDDGKGNYTLTLDEPIDAQVVKVHNKYDDRDEDLGFTDRAQFKNTLEKAISAEQKLNEATLGYVYDEAGNRVEERFTRATTQTTLYTYYTNSNRLLSNGKDAFVYDANGNLIKKGNTYTIGAGQQVTFTTTGEGVEYWEYGYDLRNQLVQVTKNGQLVGSYSYDGEGLRVAGTSGGISRHYVFDPAGRVIYETRVGGGSGSNPTEPSDTSYVFAFGQHLAKVAGTIGGGGEVSYYHNDQLGSPMALTDKTGKVVWNQDYLPYGQDLNENAQGGDTRFKFTGKEQDGATGLYYYNSRWYDPDLGRFVTEDSYAGDPNDPQELNRYAYGKGNPLKYIDPDGHREIVGDDPIRERPSRENGTLTAPPRPKGGRTSSNSGSDNDKSGSGESGLGKSYIGPNIAANFPQQLIYRSSNNIHINQV